MNPRIEAAHRLELAPITRPFGAFAVGPRGNIPGENSLAVAAQIGFDFFNNPSNASVVNGSLPRLLNSPSLFLANLN